MLIDCVSWRSLCLGVYSEHCGCGYHRGDLTSRLEGTTDDFDHLLDSVDLFLHHKIVPTMQFLSAPSY